MKVKKVQIKYPNNQFSNKIDQIICFYYTSLSFGRLPESTKYIGSKGRIARRICPYIASFGAKSYFVTMYAPKKFIIEKQVIILMPADLANLLVESTFSLIGIDNIT